jgi:hypothetical protein
VLEPRELDQVEDDVLEAPCVALDPVQAVRRELVPGHLALERLGVADDRRERRAHLVRHVGDEVGAHALEVVLLGLVVQDEDGAALAVARDDLPAGEREREASLVGAGLDALRRGLGSAE